MEQLQKATIEDYVRAVDTDGKVVDVYSTLAAQALQITGEAVTQEQRRQMKSAMLFHIYGGKHSSC